MSFLFSRFFFLLLLLFFPSVAITTKQILNDPVSLVYKSLILLHGIYCFQIQRKWMRDKIIDKPTLYWQMTATDTRTLHPALLMSAYCESLSCFDREELRTVAVITVVHCQGPVQGDPEANECAEGRSDGSSLPSYLIRKT